MVVTRLQQGDKVVTTLCSFDHGCYNHVIRLCKFGCNMVVISQWRIQGLERGVSCACAQ